MNSEVSTDPRENPAAQQVLRFKHAQDRSARDDDGDGDGDDGADDDGGDGNESSGVAVMQSDIHGFMGR